jgi:hypothetical protein
MHKKINFPLINIIKVIYKKLSVLKLSIFISGVQITPRCLKAASPLKKNNKYKFSKKKLKKYKTFIK